MSGKINTLIYKKLCLCLVIATLRMFSSAQDSDSVYSCIFTPKHARVLDFLINNKFTNSAISDDVIVKYFSEPYYIYNKYCNDYTDTLLSGLQEFCVNYYLWNDAMYQISNLMPDSAQVCRYYNEHLPYFTEPARISFYCAVLTKPINSQIESTKKYLKKLYSLKQYNFEKSISEGITISYEKGIALTKRTTNYNVLSKMKEGDMVINANDSINYFIYLADQIIPPKVKPISTEYVKCQNMYSRLYCDSLKSLFFTKLDSIINMVFSPEYHIYCKLLTQLNPNDAIAFLKNSSVVRFSDIGKFQFVSPELTISPDSEYFESNLKYNYLYPLFFRSLKFDFLDYDTLGAKIFFEMFARKHYFDLYLKDINNYIQNTEQEKMDYYNKNKLFFSTPIEAAYLQVIYSDTSQSSINSSKIDCINLYENKNAVFDELKIKKSGYTIIYEPLREIKRYFDFYDGISKSDVGAFLVLYQNRNKTAIYITEKKSPQTIPFDKVSTHINQEIRLKKYDAIYNTIWDETQKNIKLIKTFSN